MIDNDSTKRFSDRVTHYVKHRPSYPPELTELLESSCGLRRDSMIADIGSGTGILTKIFLDKGYYVTGIEPNREMREAAEIFLAEYPGFRSLDASAEATTLESNSVDLITAGQAFHWFDRAKCKTEFKRILKPGGYAVIIWNDRKIEATLFLREYEELIKKFATDYEKVDHKKVGYKEMDQFFTPMPFKFSVFQNSQIFNLDGLIGRMLSSSYLPNTGQPGYLEMISETEKLFAKHQSGGVCRFEYNTTVFYGQLD